MMTKMMHLNRGILFASRQMLYMPYLSKDRFFNELPSYEVIVRSIADLECHYHLALCWKEERELPMMARKFIDAMEQSYPKYQQDEDYLHASAVYYPSL